MNSFSRLATAAKDWMTTWASRVEHIIGKINDRALPVGALFDDLPSIAEQGARR